MEKIYEMYDFKDNRTSHTYRVTAFTTLRFHRQSLNETIYPQFPPPKSTNVTETHFCYSHKA